jgi:hypothetical protein
MFEALARARKSRGARSSTCGDAAVSADEVLGVLLTGSLEFRQVYPPAPAMAVLL